MCKKKEILKIYTAIDKFLSYYENNKIYKKNEKKFEVVVAKIDKNNERETEDYLTLVSEIRNCKKCRLYEFRNNVVIGEGNLNANIMFIGEGPGEQEDLTGRPFVGRAGKLLDRYFKIFNINRNKVYITNIVKCRPPNNRNPQIDESIKCFPYLFRQVNLIKPKLIIGLGLVSSQFILETKLSLSKIRGKFYKIKKFGKSNNIYFYATYHPSALLRNKNLEPYAKLDFQKIFYFCKKNNIVIN